MSCCEDISAVFSSEDDLTACKKCGEDTVDGISIDICGYSPVLCDECGYAPCDLSC